MTEHQQRRLQNWRLKVLEEAAARGNVAKTCRHYGISRKIFYRWRRRYEAEGLAGLRDRSHVPRHCPRMTDPEIVPTLKLSRRCSTPSALSHGTMAHPHVSAALPRDRDC